MPFIASDAVRMLLRIEIHMPIYPAATEQAAPRRNDKVVQNAKASADDQKKHQDFVNRMEEKGYTPKQVRLLSEWYLRVRKSS